MSWFYKPYVPVAIRRDEAAKKIKDLEKKGRKIEPVKIIHRSKIAGSFWGRAWCEHLESYSDYANRLPRGRTYARNGSVLHLGVEPGSIDALVMGSSLYRQTIRIDPLPKDQWDQLKKKCQGKIGSLVELLQGKISDEIMAIVTDRKDGLFPGPRQIHTDCDCPDWADLCKHLAAVLYGFGARLDTAPELLFTLRGVDHNELIASSTSGLAAATGKSARRRTLKDSTLNTVFGVDFGDEEQAPSPDPSPEPKPATKATKKATRKAVTKRAVKKVPKKNAVKKVPKKRVQKKSSR